MSPVDLPHGNESVPTFPCIVYVRRTESGRVAARVANLAGIAAEGSSEREALAKVVPAFKQAVGAFLQKGDEIPWLEPPLPMESGEQKRFLPTHL